MKRVSKGFIILVGIFLLVGCADKKKTDSKETATKETVSSSKAISSEKNTLSSTTTQTTSSSNTNTSTAGTTASTTASSTSTSTQTTLFTGYSAEQIEYARVTEALLGYYGITQQPVEITVVKNPANQQVLPFEGSEQLKNESVTLTFSTDRSMARTAIVTYQSNHNGSIYFYQNPTHYQDSRYVTDPAWVKEESQKLMNNMQFLTIPTTNDQLAAQIIKIIKIS